MRHFLREARILAVDLTGGNPNRMSFAKEHAMIPIKPVSPTNDYHVGNAALWFIVVACHNDCTSIEYRVIDGIWRVGVRDHAGLHEFPIPPEEIRGDTYAFYRSYFAIETNPFDIEALLCNVKIGVQFCFQDEDLVITVSYPKHLVGNCHSSLEEFDLVMG